MEMTFKKLSILFIFFLVGLFSVQSRISYIDQDRNWYSIYNENHSRVTSVSTSNGHLVAYSSEVFILRSGNWYLIYNEKGRRVNSLNVSSIGTIINVIDDVIISKKDSWIYQWDINGRRLDVSSAHH